MAHQPMPRTPLSRHAEPRLREALADTRIVALVGPRQSGKTTLARQIGASRGMSFLSLDDEQLPGFANDDPAGFLRGLDRAVIDEIQRAPGLILGLKKAVDEDPRPGRFLITGSVDLFRSAISPDSLAGRVDTVELLPFSQAEIAQLGPPHFLACAFQAAFPAMQATGSTPQLTERVVAGGYPEALARPDSSRRRAWLTAYARALAERDVMELAAVAKTAALARLLDHAAVAASQTINLAGLAAPLGVDGKTVDRWLSLLEQMFVVRRLPAWHRNELKRLVKSPKLHFLDSGLLAALRHLRVDQLRHERDKLGSLLESFVFAELSKLAGLAPDPVTFSHYRDRDQIEVDLVMEQAGKVVAIEVKASASVKPDDFRGLKRLKEAVGGSFACGIVLHDGDRIQQTGDRLFAMPFNQLWQCAGS